MHIHMAVTRAWYFAVLMASAIVAAVLLAIVTPSLAIDCPRSPGAKELTVVVYLDSPMANMVLVATDEGSGANRDLSVFKPKTGYWFGHTARQGFGDLESEGYSVEYSGDLSAPNSALKPPVGWNRIWGLRRCSDRCKVYGLWCPQAPQGYVPLGCIFRQTSCECYEAGCIFPRIRTCGTSRQNQADNPPTNDEVKNFVTLRQDLAAPASSSGVVWADHASGAQDDGSVFTLKGDTNKGCGTTLGIMMAQAGYPDSGDTSQFRVPDKTKVDVILQ